MFGKKRHNTHEDVPLGPQDSSGNKSVKDPGYVVHTMPTVFYGGADPHIYHPQEHAAPKKAPAVLPTPKPKEKKKVAPKAPVPARSPQSSAAPARVVAPPPPTKTPTAPNGRRSKKKGLLMIFLVLLFIGAVAVISWFYIRRDLAVVPPTRVAPPTNTTPPPVVNDTPPPVVDTPTTTPAPEEIEQPVSLVDTPVIVFPKVVLPVGNDLDDDGLFDDEESIFGTDNGVWDSDNDSYFDGLEVSNLYSPIAFAPVRLIDSGLVREYRDSVLSYRVYYPNSWVADVVGADERQVLYSFISGDFISAVIVDKELGESFGQWFSRIAAGERIQAYRPFTNRFGLEGYRRDDGLVGFFEQDRSIVVFIYNPAPEQEVANYPMVLEVMLQSFRTASGGVLPVQQIVPGTTSAPVATSTQDSDVVSTTEQ